MDYPRGVRPMRGGLQIRYTVDGRRYEETLQLPETRSGLTEAARVRKERIRLRKYGEASAIEPRPFEQVAQEYLNSVSSSIALSTRNSYRDSLNIYWAGLSGRDVASITGRQILDIDDATDWPSSKTRDNAIIPLRQAFRYAVSRGYCLTSPVALQGRRRRDKAGPHPYTIADRDRLLAWLDGTLAGPFFRVAFGTGARTGELLALTWDDFDGKHLYVKQARVRGKIKDTKTGKARRVLLLPEIAETLRALPRPIRGGFIFANQYGRGYQSGYHLNKWFRKAHTATKIVERSGPYPWRHTYASIALSAGVKPSLIAAQLGHRLDVLLSTYGKYIPRDDDALELSKMGAAWVQENRESS
jgi:integrase